MGDSPQAHEKVNSYYLCPKMNFAIKKGKGKKDLTFVNGH